VNKYPGITTKRFRMKKNISIVAVLFSIVSLFSCKGNDEKYDATGTFEATETIVSAEATGVIESFVISEGQVVDSGKQVGFIDTTTLFLKKKELQSQINTIGAKLPNISAQTAQFQQQAAVTQSHLDFLLKERTRTQNLVKADAATPKELDNINAQIEQAQQQIKAIKKQGSAQASALRTQRSGISSNASPLAIQIEQVNEQLQKSKIINPVKGTVLTKFAEEGEMAMIGKPLYTIADLSTIILRAYITGDQFAFIKLGQKVKVLVDDTTAKSREYEGTINWISNKAEFTPKTIQTKNERANLVYAIKISVKNDGILKIGMYGEVKF